MYFICRDFKVFLNVGLFFCEVLLFLFGLVVGFSACLFVFCIPTNEAVGKKQHLKETPEMAWVRNCRESPALC